MQNRDHVGQCLLLSRVVIKMLLSRVVVEGCCRGLLSRVVVKGCCQGLLPRVVVEGCCGGLLSRVVVKDRSMRRGKYILATYSVGDRGSILVRALTILFEGKRNC